MKLTAYSYLDAHALDSKALHPRPVEKNLCDACSLKSKCNSGRAVNQRLDEEHHDRVRSCCRKFPYEKAQRKHKAGNELLRRGREGHGRRVVRLRTLERVNAEVLMIVPGRNVKRGCWSTDAGDRGKRRMAQAEALGSPEGQYLRYTRRHRATC